MTLPELEALAQAKRAEITQLEEALDALYLQIDQHPTNVALREAYAKAHPFQAQLVKDMYAFHAPALIRAVTEVPALIIDDPGGPSTPEQREAALKWHEYSFPDRRLEPHQDATFCNGSMPPWPAGCVLPGCPDHKGPHRFPLGPFKAFCGTAD